MESCQETVPEAITAFLEGNDFEDVIRTAVSLGGDCDTLTCIASSIAEAFYGVPDYLKAECVKRLPADMAEILFARIRKMETYLDEATEAVRNLSEAFDRYEEVRDKYHRLVKYYESPEWREDFEADEAGLLPAELKRGVLSEDAVYDLITEHDELMRRIHE